MALNGWTDWKLNDDGSWSSHRLSTPRLKQRELPFLTPERCIAKAWSLANSLQGYEEPDLSKWKLAVRRLENAYLFYSGDRHAQPLGEPKT